MTTLQHIRILGDAADVLRTHEYHDLARRVLIALKEIAGVEPQLLSRSTRNREQYAGHGPDPKIMDAIQQERRAVDSACTRSPIAAEPAILEWDDSTPPALWSKCGRYVVHHATDGWFCSVTGAPVSGWSKFMATRTEAVLWAEQHAWGAEQAKILEEEGIRF